MIERILARNIVRMSGAGQEPCEFADCTRIDIRECKHIPVHIDYIGSIRCHNFIREGYTMRFRAKFRYFHINHPYGLILP